MRIFVTGSTGYVGSAIVRALVKAGHHVGGLYRNLQKEQLVRSLGATPIFGHLRDPETYQHFAAECEAVVHAGFESPESDQIATEALMSALIAEGEKKAFIYTSGIWNIGNTGLTTVDETAPVDKSFHTVAWRAAVERYVLNAANEQLATAVVRPGLVYGGHGGLIGGYFQSATTEGAAVYIGDGRNHTALVHRDDLAQLYRLIAEEHARGIFHGVDGQHPTILEVATACSRAAGKGGATRSMSVAEASQQMGAWVEAMTLDQRIVAERSTQHGWKPAHHSFLESATPAFNEWKA